MTLLQDRHSASRNEKANKITTRVQRISSGYKASTSSKGCVESKGTSRQAGTAFFAVRVVNNLTLFSMSFNSRFFLDTREGSDKPEYVHNLETLA
jgi:hypothetical protein